ncbi:MAG: hypothetical protein ACC628_27560, partial [Pirellulaceae bacterium]
MYSYSLEMALSVSWKLVRTSFLPHRDGLFEGSRDDSIHAHDLFTLVQGLGVCAAEGARVQTRIQSRWLR